MSKDNVYRQQFTWFNMMGLKSPRPSKEEGQQTTTAGNSRTRGCAVSEDRKKQIFIERNVSVVYKSSIYMTIGTCDSPKQKR